MVSYRTKNIGLDRPRVSWGSSFSEPRAHQLKALGPVCPRGCRGTVLRHGSYERFADSRGVKPVEQEEIVHGYPRRDRSELAHFEDHHPPQTLQSELLPPLKMLLDLAYMLIFTAATFLAEGQGV